MGVAYFISLSLLSWSTPHTSPSPSHLTWAPHIWPFFMMGVAYFISLSLPSYSTPHTWLPSLSPYIGPAWLTCFMTGVVSFIFPVYLLVVHRILQFPPYLPIPLYNITYTSHPNLSTFMWRAQTSPNSLFTFISTIISLHPAAAANLTFSSTKLPIKKTKNQIVHKHK